MSTENVNKRRKGKYGAHHAFVPFLVTDYDEKQVLTCKYWFDPNTIDPTGQLRRAIDKTLEYSGDIYKMMLEYANEHQTTSIKAIHNGTYEALSRQAKADGYPTAFIQCVRDDLRRDLKSWNTQHPSKRWQLDAHRKNNASVALDKRTFTFDQERMECTISKIGKRFKVALDPRDGDWFFKRHNNLTFESDPKAGRLGKKKKRGCWCYYIAICYKYSPVLPQYDPDANNVKGIDRGMHEPFVTSDGDVSPEARHDTAVARRYAYNAAQAKSKGTKSAKRHLRMVSGRRARFRLDCARRYAHEVLDDMSAGDVLVVEDLTGINARTIAKYKHSREYNAAHSSWNHAQFLSELKFLAFQKSVLIVAVNPAYTSQTCPSCGTVDSANRYKGAFECVECGFTGYADAVAAVVIRQLGVKALREVLPAEYWRQADVNQPNETRMCLNVSASS